MVNLWRFNQLQKSKTSSSMSDILISLPSFNSVQGMQIWMMKSATIGKYFTSLIEKVESVNGPPKSFFEKYARYTQSPWSWKQLLAILAKLKNCQQILSLTQYPTLKRQTVRARSKEECECSFTSFYFIRDIQHSQVYFGTISFLILEPSGTEPATPSSNSVKILRSSLWKYPHILLMASSSSFPLVLLVI